MTTASSQVPHRISLGCRGKGRFGNNDSTFQNTNRKFKKYCFHGIYHGLTVIKKKNVYYTNKQPAEPRLKKHFQFDVYIFFLFSRVIYTWI